MLIIIRGTPQGAPLFVFVPPDLQSDGFLNADLQSSHLQSPYYEYMVKRNPYITSLRIANPQEHILIALTVPEGGEIGPYSLYI